MRILRSNILSTAGPPGLEPGTAVLETAVLPLNYRPTVGTIARMKTGENRAPRSGARYDTNMRSRIFFFSFLLFAAGSLALPLAAHAMIPFFGPIINPLWTTNGTANGIQCALGWGAVLTVINNIIQLLITLAIILVAPLTIAYAGFLLVTGQGNPGSLTKAKGVILNTIIGIVIALAGWLIVDAIMAVLYNPAAIGSTWSNLIMSGGYPACLPQTGIGTGLNQASISNVVATTPSNSSGGGTCAIQNSGPCAASNMNVFGTAANQASIICSAESANGTLLQGDQTTSGSYVSFGLFQINISANSVNGLNCPSAFSSMYTGSNKNIQITNQTLYNSCQQAALTPATNIQAAYNIFQSSGYSWKAWSTSTACGLTFLDNVPALSYLCDNFHI